MLLLEIVRTVSPVSPSIEVSKIQAVLLAQLDLSSRSRDFTRDERPATSRALMIEQNAIARVHAIRLSVVHRDPEGVELRAAIRTARVEGRFFRLRRLDDLAIQLGGGGLVEPDVLLESACPDGVEET